MTDVKAIDGGGLAISEPEPLLFAVNVCITASDGCMLPLEAGEVLAVHESLYPITVTIE